MGVLDLRKIESEALDDPRHMQIRRVYVESPFRRDLTRRQDAEMCVFPKCAWLVATGCCRTHFTNLCLFTVVQLQRFIF